MAKISRIQLAKLSKEKLLDCRLCDLPVLIEGTMVGQCIERVKMELMQRGLFFNINFYPSDEWYCPDGKVAVAVPFYLLHPRLIKIERDFMISAEGVSELECMRILRHEMGHAIDNAYRLHHRRDWQNTFGSYAKKYPKYYIPNPASKKFVVHLDGWYAQSHPAEDFAETFAIWLKPRSRWKQEYAGTAAMKKQ